MGLQIAQMWDAADGVLVDMSSDALPGFPTQEQILDLHRSVHQGEADEQHFEQKLLLRRAPEFRFRGRNEIEHAHEVTGLDAIAPCAQLLSHVIAHLRIAAKHEREQRSQHVGERREKLREVHAGVGEPGDSGKHIGRAIRAIARGYRRAYEASKATGGGNGGKAGKTPAAAKTAGKAKAASAAKAGKTAGARKPAVAKR